MDFLSSYINFQAKIENEQFIPYTDSEPNCYILDQTLFYPFLDKYLDIGKDKIISRMLLNARKAGIKCVHEEARYEGVLGKTRFAGMYFYSKHYYELLKFCKYAYECLIDEYTEPIYKHCLHIFSDKYANISRELLYCYHYNLPKPRKALRILRNYDLFIAIGGNTIYERINIHNNMMDLVERRNENLQFSDEDYVYRAIGVDKWIGNVAYYVSDEPTLKELIVSTLKSLYR